MEEVAGEKEGREQPCLEELEYSLWQRRVFEEMRRRTDSSNQMIVGFSI